MLVKKVVSLSEEEVGTLVATGKLLKEIKGGFESSEIDSLDENSKQLIAAVYAVMSEVVGR